MRCRSVWWLLVLSACGPGLAVPWEPDADDVLPVTRCQPTEVVSSTEVPFSPGGGFLAARPGTYGWLNPGTLELETFFSDPRLSVPARIISFANWPRQARRPLLLRGARIGFVALAGNQPSDPDGLARLHLEGERLVFEPLAVSRWAHAADTTRDGGWVALVSDRGLPSLNDQVTEVVASSSPTPLRSFDGGVSALRVTAPDVISVLDSSGPRVLVGAGDQLELPACVRPSALPFAPVVKPFAGGRVVVQQCDASVILARYGNTPRPEATLEVNTGSLFWVDAAVDSAGRLAVATSHAERPPVIRLFHLDDLSVAHEALSLAPLMRCSSRGLLQIEADPTAPGRFAVLAAHAIGHGEGCAAVTRLELCAPQ